MASAPERRRSLGATIGSVAIHVALLGGFVWGSSSVVEEVDALPAAEHITYIQLTQPDFSEPAGPEASAASPAAPEPEPKTSPEAEAPPEPTPPDPIEPEFVEPELADLDPGFRTLAQPEVVVPEIPGESAQPAFASAEFTGEGVKGGGPGEPAAGGADGDGYGALMASPRVTPYSVPPDLQNRNEIARALEKRYPPRLRDRGIGGQAVLWAFLDEEGNVLKAEIKQSSGRDELDEAALEVVELMRFSAAQHGGYAVPVWVSVPIRFQVR